MQAVSPRQADIVALARQAGRVDVDGLAAHFKVTPQTIRKDLNELCEQGLMRRYHGGAMLTSGAANVDYESRRALMPHHLVKSELGATSRDFRIAVSAAGFAEVLRRSPYADGLTLRTVEEIAAGAARAEYPEDAELLALIRRARQLSGQ